MSVHVKGEGCGCVSEVFLDRFIIISVLERENGEGVSEVVDSGSVNAEPPCEFVVVEVCLFGVDR